jgi:hypothetical protein
MKKGGSSRKGSEFERQICRKLSLWFSDNQRFDLFWRNSGSGARSTTLAKQGKSISNSAGDIGYLDIEGKPLLDKVTFELKAGYSASDTTSLIDLGANRKLPLLYQFIQQAVSSSKQAGTPHWAVIQKRNKRKELIHFSYDLFLEIDTYCQQERKYSLVDLLGQYQTTKVINQESGAVIFSAPFDDFCVAVPASFFKSNRS